MKLGYLIPEFPGQTHIWMWRELCHLREWGVPIRIYSTRRPEERDRARHAFAASAEKETCYLWPPGALELLGAMLWALVLHPWGLLGCVWLGMTLPVDARPRRWSVLRLIPPACILARQVRRDGVGHLHSHTCANSAVLCMMVKRLVRVPFSMTLNANIEWWGGAMGRKFQDAEFTVAITQWLLDQMRREYPALRPEQCLLGRIGVDTRSWVPPPAKEHAPPLRLVTVSRLHPAKGQDVLLRAFAALRARGVKATLRIIGSGPEESALQALTRELGLSENVRFLGSLPEHEVRREVGEADVFVLASHAEPLGVVYMEAMALAVVTVGTAAGGVGEIITDGVDGVLVPPKDSGSLADALARLAADPGLRERLGRSGRRTIEERFDSRRGAATLYERLLGRAPVTSPQETPSRGGDRVLGNPDASSVL
jgi:colanic acid/amylovoran biosynthesis glycosyltransferase